MTSTACGRVFVGRGADLARLDDAVERAASGAPSTLLIGGEPGIGKSRLLDEFSGRHHRTVEFLLGGCVEQGSEGLPFAPFTAVLRALVGRLGAAEVTELLGAGSVVEAGRLLPELAHGTQAADDEFSRARLFEQLLGLLRRLSPQRPVVLAVEDAHWADASSRALIDFLVRNQAAAPHSLIVLSYRSDELHTGHPLRGLLAELDRVAWVQRLPLERLTRRDVGEQIRLLHGREPKPEQVEQVYRRSEGNPLFVEALLDTDSAAAELPGSLGDLLLSRVRGLAPQSRDLVSLVAVGGASVPQALLAAASGLEVSALTAALRPAVEGNVLVADETHLAFRHALIQEAALADLLPGERESLHARYAETLSADPALAPEGRAAGALARHHSGAGDVAAALSAAWQAAGDAANALAYTEQLAMLTLVLRLWDQTPGAADAVGADRATVLEQAAQAADNAGEHEEGERLATMALAAVDRPHERVRTAMLLQLRGRLRRTLGHSGDLDDLEEAVLAAPADHPVSAVARNALAGRLATIPDPARARRTAEQALAMARETGDDHSEADALIILGMLTARRGATDTGFAQLDEARTIAERIGAHSLRLLALERFSHLLEAFGECERAAEVAGQGIAAARDVGLQRAVGAKHAGNLVLALCALGRWDQAREAVDGGLELGPPPSYAAYLRCLGGWIAALRGDLVAAQDALAAGRRVPVGDVGWAQESLLTQLEAEVEVLRGRPERALAVIEATLAAADAASASRFSLPLLVLAARAARAAGSPLRPWQERAETVPAFGPVQRAHTLTFAAECEPSARTRWDGAVAAWDALGHPLPLARALLGAAEAALTDGDREGAGTQLRRASELADQLGARPLAEHVQGLARRARIPLGNVAVPPAGTAELGGLTGRELDVLRLVAEGRGNREIAETLFISPKTASVHVSHLLAKLGAANRVEAAATAHRLGLLDPSKS